MTVIKRHPTVIPSEETTRDRRLEQVELRVTIMDTVHCIDPTREAEERDRLAGALMETLHLVPELMEYRFVDRGGPWRNGLDGGEPLRFEGECEPQLSPAQVRHVLQEAGLTPDEDDEYGEPMRYIAFRRGQNGLLSAGVRAGWLPSFADVGLALRGLYVREAEALALSTDGAERTSAIHEAMTRRASLVQLLAEQLADLELRRAELQKE